MALNTAFANETLISTGAALTGAEDAAHRTSFLLSIRSRLNHTHAVDRYCTDAQTRGGLGPHAFYPPISATPQRCDRYRRCWISG